MPRNIDKDRLHPEFRRRLDAFLGKLPASADEWNFALFEAFRTPQRQRELYAQGRTRRGPIVTDAPPWRSYHQYGLAADIVLSDGHGNWSWRDDGSFLQRWNAMHEIARAEGLEPLGNERPHVQMTGVRLDSLLAGDYPGGGDTTWADNLEATIESWSSEPRSPPLPGGIQRPPLEGANVGGSPVALKVIARGGLWVRSGPGTEFPTVRSLPFNQMLFSLRNEGGWALVDIEGDGSADGYCHTGFLAAA